MVSRTELTLWVHRKDLFPTGPKSLPPVPFAAGLAAVTAAESPLGRYALSAADLFAVGLTATEAMKQATRNGQGDVARKATTDGAGLYTWDTEHAGVVAVSGPRIARLLGLEGMPVVMLPTPNVVVLASRDNPAALEALLVLAEVTYDEARDPCSLRAISWDGPLATPRAWLPPEGHPLRSRFLAAAGRTRCDTLRALHAACEGGEGPLAPLHVDSDGALVAEWRPGASVVIPEVERVVLRASDDEAIEVDLDVLRLVMPHVLDPLPWPVGPYFLRTCPGAFPSQRGRAFLARRPSAAAVREVDADDLLAAWDAGDPVLVESEAMEDGWLRLMHPDLRVAVVSRDRFGARVAALEDVDQKALQPAFPVRGMRALRVAD